MMQLVQFNWFLDKGLLTADPKTARLTVHYDRYPEAVTSLLTEVLKLQHEGDKTATARVLRQMDEMDARGAREVGRTYPRCAGSAVPDREVRGFGGVTTEDERLHHRDTETEGAEKVKNNRFFDSSVPLCVSVSLW